MRCKKPAIRQGIKQTDEANKSTKPWARQWGSRCIKKDPQVPRRILQGMTDAQGECTRPCRNKVGRSNRGHPWKTNSKYSTGKRNEEARRDEQSSVRYSQKR